MATLAEVDNALYYQLGKIQETADRAQTAWATDKDPIEVEVLLRLIEDKLGKARQSLAYLKAFPLR